MIKRCFLMCVLSAEYCGFESHNCADSIGPLDCIETIESEESADTIDSIDFIDSIDSIDAILMPHNRSPTFTPHTKGARASRAPTTVPMGHALRARPLGIVVFPFVCGLNVGDLLCGTSIASIESIKSLEPIESVVSSDSIESMESIQSIQSIEPIESIEL